MEGDGNHTSVAMFVLLGLSDDKELQLILFSVFLGIYLVTLTWNLGLIILIRLDFHLQTPMYFFLSFLSFIDVCYSSSIVPRMLADFLKDEKTISLMACATQYLVVAWMAVAECCLLATMAYDSYVPLVIMTLSCSDPFISQLILFLAAAFVGFGSFLLILLSYGFVAASILKISSLQGCAKALNTCTSHLATVTLFYGTALSVCTHHGSSHTTEQDKVLSVFYVILSPMLNPLVYSLRNKEIKEALRRVIKKVAS
ncbi:Olfactory receptor 5A1 [Sciurus carolinensis]|uniref:Olfactory receptor 5A1 n=1 Tax=Sciurus carolinensis TaxID=30640 RepID=A0AA41MLY6_SCICA|nr:Olfactory receptor 5A1 [Sciurus carolinensis]